jgi:hypothetical protein
MAENIEAWPLGWITVGDEKVCPECEDRNTWEPRTLTEWEEYGLPGRADTSCRGHCRCVLLPEQLIEIYPKLKGTTVKLRDADDSLRITREINTKLYSDLDALVNKYETITDNWNLPESYYKISDVQARIKFLDNVIYQIQSGTIQPDLWGNILLTNPYLEGA